MSGAAVIAELLNRRATLVALVPTTSIMSGVIPPDTPLPVIGITEVVGTDRATLAREPTTQVTDRVQVTVIAQSYHEVKAILGEVRRACRDFVGQLPGLEGVADVVVHTDGKGPDGTQLGTVLPMQTQDFRVSYSEDS